MATTPTRAPIATVPQFTRDRSPPSPLPFNYSSASAHSAEAARAAASSPLATRGSSIEIQINALDEQARLKREVYEAFEAMLHQFETNSTPEKAAFSKEVCNIAPTYSWK